MAGRHGVHEENAAMQGQEKKTTVTVIGAGAGGGRVPGRCG